MSKPPGRSPVAVLSSLTATALVTTALVAGSTVGAAAAPQSLGGGQGHIDFDAGRYIVTLDDEAASTYEGGISGYTATAPGEGEQLDAESAPVEEYTDFLEEKQEDVAASVGADIDYSYTLSLNGFAADLTADQAAELATHKDVALLAPDELRQVTAVPSTDFLGLSGENGVWQSVGGVEEAGKGVVVGVLDTGIAPENPSFAGEPLGTTVGPEPYREGDTIVFEKNDGETFTGVCQPGVQFTAEDCNTKIVGARYFVEGFGQANLGTPETGEYVSPRDGDGHGSHTASTAAGNPDVPVAVRGIEYGTLTGVAPAAKVAAYKVCWSGPDPAVDTDDGCATSDLLAGIDAAVEDGVDVINFSIGGGAAQSTVSATDAAFLGAAAAGIFVSASAGNDGPGASTLDNASPWITTVAASTIPSYEATVTFSNGAEFAGASITVQDEVTAPVVLASASGLAGAESPNLCLPGTLDPAKVTGKIVVCERGVNARAEKSQVVADAGGVGMVLVNVNPGSIDIDEHAVPSVHLDSTYYAQVVAAASLPDATATLSPGNLTDYTPPTPQVAGFSSRGPVLADGSDILKPDVAAPGVSIIAAGANAEGADPTFKFLSGTSMAAPHVAGLAALYLGERPEATPAEIKSALMTTAYDTVDAAAATVTDPFAQGAGHVDPTRFFEPGLLYLNDLPDWLAYAEGIGLEAADPSIEPIDPSNLNLASIAIGSLTAPETITRTVTSTQAGTFEASIQGLPGIEAVVSPSVLTFGAAGEEQSYSITFTRTDAPLDQFSTGSVTWTSGETTVRSPIAIQPVTIVAPDQVDGEGVTGSVPVEVIPGGTGDIPLSTTGLSKGTLQADPTGTETEHSGSGITGDYFEYLVEVPEGTAFARFDLDSIDDTADLDLFVYQLNEAGTPIALWQSATGAADERVDIEAPEAATYYVEVDVYSAATETAFDLVTTAVSETGAPLTLDPPVLPGVQGEPVTYTASWSGLDPLSDYLGLVRYGETGEYTVVSVETGEAPAPDAPVNIEAPTISGTPQVGKTLRADPGEWDIKGLKFTYQWQADGEPIAGATKKTYKVASADQGKEITVVVTAAKKGLPNGTATSEPVLVK